MHRRLLITGLIVAIVANAVPFEAGNVLQADDLIPLNGPRIVRFDKPLDSLSIRKGTQFGIFRAPEPKQKQFIVESWRQEKLPDDAGTMPALVLKYSVNDGYNGFWIGLGGADWSRHSKGYLVLRILKGPSVWKLELKDVHGRSYPAIIRLNGAHLDDIRTKGFTDLAIPLSTFRMPSYKDLTECVFVFESTRIPQIHRRGELLIAEIALSDTVSISGSADAILDELGRKVFAWFQKYRHPTTGLVLDRGPNDADYKHLEREQGMASLASVGFHLSLLPEWVRLGYISEAEARRQALMVLEFTLASVEHHGGILYHFVDWRSGKRWEQCEVSTLDTAIFLNGAMTAAVHFGGLVDAATQQLLDRADWRLFLVEKPDSGKPLLSLGWKPNTGLLGPADVRTSEMAMPYFLAIGSKHSIPVDCWFNTTVEYKTIGGYSALHAHLPLFTAYYSLAWHDLQGQKDRDGVDLYRNAELAAQLNREFCKEESRRFPTYSAANGSWWGISAGDAPTGYVAPGPIAGDADGVVWPMTALAAVCWMPDEIRRDVANWRDSRLWDAVDGPYGLRPFRVDANDAAREYYCADLIGIDVGMYGASLANYRSRTIWKLWKQHPVAMEAFRRLRLTEQTQ